MLTCPKCQSTLPLQGAQCPRCGADVNWWSSRGGQVYGPYDLATMQFCRQDGRVVDDDYVRCGEGLWQLARDVFPLNAPAAAAPPIVTASAPRTPASSSKGVYLAVGIAVMVVALLAMAVMAAFLFPVFARAREKAHSASCQMNLKQIGMALRMYSADYAGCLPPAGNWSASCATYLGGSSGGRDIFACPATPDKRQYVTDAKFGSAALDGLAKATPLTAILWCPPLDKAANTGPHNGGFNELHADGSVKWVQSLSTSGP